MAFSSLDLYYKVKELQSLIDARISEIYHPNKYTIILELYSAKTGKKFLKFEVANKITLTEKKESSPKPSGFCMYLRKYLTNTKILNIQQKGFDRILEIDIQAQETTYKIISEFFPKGNFIITDNNYKILQCLEKQEWKDRTLKPGETYKTPQEQSNPLTLPQTKLQEIIKKSNKQNIVKTLAIDLSFGGEYAETILQLAKINKENLPAKISEKEIKQIYKIIQNIKNNPPTKIESRATQEQKENIKVSQQEIQRNKEIESLTQILKIQNEKIISLQQDADSEKQNGDLLYENYQETEDALNSKKTDITLNNIKIKLNPRISLADNAASYYEIAKKAKSKIDGAINSAIETKKKIEELKNKIIEIKEKQEQKEKQKRKQEWYEKHHWFFSSDGFLCIGGKDAVSNEIIVKKHAEKNDLVFHTEAPGSPFFVIKNPDNKTIPKTTLEETAQATASYSQTWKTNISSAETFYVKPDQLTKEYGVQKGTFIIRGTKKQIKTILTLAIANYNNQIIAGPVNAIKSQTPNFLTIIQGDLTKNQLAKKLKSKLSGNLEEIEKMLPNGKSKIVK